MTKKKISLVKLIFVFPFLFPFPLHVSYAFILYKLYFFCLFFLILSLFWYFIVGKQVCSYPAKLLHGYYEPVKFYYDIGDIVHIHCDHGFRLAKEFDDNIYPLHQNNETITMLCGNDGLWIGPAIKCKRLNNNKQNAKH